VRLSRNHTAERVDVDLGTDTVSLSVETAGMPIDSERRLVALIHGAGHDATVWRPLASSLVDRGWTVMSVDLPGHGQSGGSPAGSIERQAEIVAQVIAGSQQRAATIIGHSMGGLIALEVAAQQPELVDCLVLIATGAALPVSDLLLDAAAGENDDAAELLDRWAHSRTVEASARAKTRSMLDSLDHGVLHAALVACDNYVGGVEAATRITAPTLLITGAHDVMVDSGEIAGLELALSDVTTVTIPDSGHNVAVDRPDELFDAIEEFLDAHSSSV
jgi:pimeloyl-ACP methyl ester carboxylesterase